MELKYEIDDLNKLNKKFVDHIFNNDVLIDLKSQLDEVDFMWDFVNTIKPKQFKSRKQFEELLSSLDTTQLDEFIYLIHSENVPKLINFITILQNNDSDINTFDVLYFKFLTQSKTQPIVSLQLDNYIFVGGNSRKKIKSLKDELLTLEMNVLHTLSINRKWYQRSLPIYIFINNNQNNTK